jgi:hypothetical protein
MLPPRMPTRFTWWLAAALFGACGRAPTPAEVGAAPAAVGEVAKSGPAKARLVALPSGSECLHGKGHDDAGECGSGAAAAGSGHFGAPFQLSESRALREVLGGAAETRQSPVLVRGEVTAVCQKKGCWMVLRDGDAQARVLMKDHAFTVPFDGKGKQAIVEGTIEQRTLSEGQVRHIEEDAGRDPAGVSGSRTEYILTASAVELGS